MDSIALKYVHNKQEQDLLLQLDNIDYLKIEWIVRNASYIHMNQVLAEVTYTIREIRERLFSSYEVSETYSFKILAPNAGFLYIEEDMFFYDENEESGTISWESTEPKIYSDRLQKVALIFQTRQELELYHFDTKRAELETDPYTNLSNINWNKFRYLHLNNDGNSGIKLDFINDKSVFVFESVERLRKGDCISLLFENNQIIDYLIQNEPTKVHAIYECLFTLYKEDVELLLNYQLISYRITYINNRLPAKTIFIIQSRGIFNNSIYVRCYLDALNRLVSSYKLPQRTIAQSPTEYNFNWCYVYLMKDTSNGYHKIGISNTPEYRERTLQSEKPTIEMLACKKFPTRKIAESIESALHTAYIQQRLRGEWFNLTESDVAAIIETLK